ncbi:hypothetical protein XELAEV_18045909mg [Xenopus laevis]|uniref:Uncharacterized protein n=1 Tax=Xenopus laevis TaxID=8355 RepID=A0A974BSD8_XENLA|nr:hypothetical protein XELAEV_18045909mg [Xenopus laevis]
MYFHKYVFLVFFNAHHRFCFSRQPSTQTRGFQLVTFLLLTCLSICSVPAFTPLNIAFDTMAHLNNIL